MFYCTDPSDECMVAVFFKPASERQIHNEEKRLALRLRSEGHMASLDVLQNASEGSVSSAAQSSAAAR